ncbi:hypothetical protein F442_14585 [Phytophthora nicotianae P10297]|uniref:Uncharacterized protein n=2 Tax=Phytophthora nicotianae TaxID=4792 RepID=W2YRE8_PHYNI|nr:hypothetical protein L917_14057 [Phytophthora nicotianae]ETP37605.1 hypothetical protein F442_14585 [Phytophthora nicotianae P10297]
MSAYDEIAEITKRLRIAPPNGIDTNFEVPNDDDLEDLVFVSIDESPVASGISPVKAVMSVARRAHTRHRSAPYSRSRRSAMHDELAEMIDLQF